VDAAKFPHLDLYLRKLPAGIDSYPKCFSRGAMLRSSVQGQAFHPSWETLPPVICEALRSPPLPTEWVSTVLTDAVFYAVLDTYHPTPSAMLSWTYERTMEAADSPAYRMFTKLAGVRAFLRGAVKVHAFFQRGTDLRMDLGDGEALIWLEHPPYLHLGLNHLSNEASFRASLESAGAKDVEVTMLESVPKLARYRARWRP
jgi:hypothetical protein